MGKINLNFNSDFSGKVVSERSGYTFSISKEEAFPYELAIAGLVSCFYSTFMDVAVKKRLEWEAVDIEADWSKQVLNTPTFLKKAHLKINVKVIKGKTTAFDKSFELAAKYCSLYQTFSKVGEVSWEASYINDEA